MLIKEQLSKVACKSTNLTAGQRCNPLLPVLSLLLISINFNSFNVRNVLPTSNPLAINTKLMASIQKQQVRAWDKRFTANTNAVEAIYYNPIKRFPVIIS